MNCVLFFNIFLFLNTSGMLLNVVELPVCITENKKCTAAWNGFFSLLHADF